MPVDSVVGALGWGAVTGLGILLGTLLGLYGKFSHSTIARVTALGAGLLLAAASVELAAEVIHAAPYQGVAAILVGAAAFSLGNLWLSTRGAKDRKRCGECAAQPSESDRPGSGLAIAMGTAMDAVPEALVLGLTLYTTGPSAALIAAITLGNLPEAMSASSGMADAGRRKAWIIGLWTLIAAGTAFLTGVGYALSGFLQPHHALLLQAFGAGALLSMVSETLVPEAVHESPHFSGFIVGVGFAVLLLLGSVAG